MVDQNFGRQNDSMSRPPLESTPIGTSTAKGTTLPSDLITVGTKSPEPTPLTLTTDSETLPTAFSNQNVKSHLPVDPDPDPEL